MSNDFKDRLPVTVEYLTITSTPLKWEPETIIVYVVSGAINIQLNENTYRLEEDDLLLINAFDLHAFRANDCKLAIFRFDLSFFRQQGIVEQRYYFDLNSTTVNDVSSLIPIKRYLALIIKSSQSTQKSDLLLIYSHTYELLHYLVTYYYVKSQNPQLPHRQRLEDIITYININYKEPITLKDIADRFYLSVPYLSKLFKEAMSQNFKDYLNNLRLTSAINDLRNLDFTIDHVASINGFHNTRSLVQVFKAKYNMLPSEYRHQLHLNPPLSDKLTPRGNPGMLFQRTLGRLADYLNPTTESTIIATETMRYTELSTIDCSDKGIQLKHTFKTLTTIGMARHLLLANFQEMLRVLQKDVGFEYLKFHGLLDDEMMVYSESITGEVQLNFTYIDAIFDFLLSVKLKPVIQLSYMPKDLASDKTRTINFLESYISLPKDYNKWTHLIRQLVIHLQNRYGPDEVNTWPFYLWNTPDAPIELSGINSKEDYFHFYKVTYDAVKSVDPNIMFGSPALMNVTMEEGSWVSEFMSFANKNNCKPAFLNYHFYPMILKDSLSKESLTASSLMLNPKPDAFKLSINTIKRNNRELGWNMDQFYITEWNSTISHRELLNDTAFKPAYIVKNLLENYDRMNSFGFWSLSDFIEEVQMSGLLFHGGLGLFTYNGIKKAQYYAFAILAKLGDQLLGKGEGYFVTKKGSSVQIIFYNYQHYSALYASGELFDMTFDNRYPPFPDPHSHKYILQLNNLKAEHYIVTDTILNKDNGSAFDKWIELGGMPLETKDEIDYLKSVSVPKITKQRVDCPAKELLISRKLEPHEVRLIEIKPEILTQI